MKKYKQSNEIGSHLEIESEYRCDKCRDLTFIIDGGEATPCECRALREAEDILKKSGISEEFRNKTFDNFDYAYDVQTIDAYRSATKYVKDFDCIESRRNNSIMFVGQVGSGKTHLSLAICNELMDSGVGVVYMGYRDVIIRVKQNIMDEVYYHKVMNRYKNARVLLIDDLFKGSVSGSDINIMFELVNHRYFNNLPVIVSSEKSFEELIEIDEAIGSRLVEMCKGYRVEIRGNRLNYRIYGV
jgi:DNA replication protein DnaC